MAIEFNCMFCEKLLRTADDRTGQMAKCPDCGASVTVPGAPVAGSAEGKSGYGNAGFKACPMCGEQIREVAVKCRHCGENIGSEFPGSRMPGRSHLTPHRGGMILAFGILSWAVCLIFGPIAWVMGNSDMAEMDAGRMDPEGRSLTQAGRIVGMVHTIVFLSIFAFVIVLLITGGLAGAL